MDVNTALIGLLAVIVLVHYFRQRDCREEIRTEVNQARRDEISRAKSQMQYAFSIWFQAAQEGKHVRDMEAMTDEANS